MAQPKKKLRIAEFDNSTAPFPLPPDFPRPLAPLLVALDIAGGLSARGHEVVFFGPRGSHSDTFQAVAVDFEPLYKNKLVETFGVRPAEREKIFSLFDQFVIARIFEEHKKKPFDVLHIHPADRALPFARLFPEVPVAYTLHDPIYPWRAEVFRMYQTPNQHFISISNAQRAPAPNLNYAATVYNGINLNEFPFSATGGDYLFFAGRLQDNKGVYEAIRVAQITGETLLIAGAPAEGDYWETKIKPHLSDRIRYVGFIGRDKLNEYYKNAKATLVPIKWEEPFGLILTESMACGTPVIAFRRGSVPEVVVDGKTGFIVDTVEEMAEAIKKVETIDRRACRAHVEAKFRIETMVDGYEKTFLKISGL